MEPSLVAAFSAATVLVLWFLVHRRRRGSVAAEAPVVHDAKAVTAPASPPAAALPKIDYEEDAAVEPTQMSTRAVSPPMEKIVYEDDAAIDEPTHSGPLILVTATAGTDAGRRRKRNEDSVLAREELGLFVVADGMGGHNGGQVASQLAVQTIDEAFRACEFRGPPDDLVPRRASELARAIQMANEAIFERAHAEKLLEGMGTTVCAARFSPTKQRVYVGHVGDSRAYRFRDGVLRQMTADHTMRALGVEGDGAAHLSRAVGVWPVVPIDVVLAKPRPGDIYLLCSDGLTKMVSDEAVGRILATAETPRAAVDALISEANTQGGTDNIAVIVVRVDEPIPRDRPRAAA